VAVERPEHHPALAAMDVEVPRVPEVNASDLRGALQKMVNHLVALTHATRKLADGHATLTGSYFSLASFFALGVAKSAVDGHLPLGSHALAPHENPQPSTWIAIGLAAVVLGGAVYLLTRPTLATTFTPGSTYSITGALPVGGGALSSIIASMTGAGIAGPQWQSVKGVDNQDGTYTITGTYAGATSTPVPPGVTVYKVG
jgi:hypothetical protein